MRGLANPINSGLIGSSTPGRTDRLKTAVPKSSYIIPADVVSGIGQGNTKAGANILDNVFSHHLHSMFRHNLTPKDPVHMKGLSTGGKTHHMPVILAGGEYHVPPEVVTSVGGGDIEKGHTLLNKMVHNVRQHTIKTLRTLPKPRS